MKVLHKTGTKRLLKGFAYDVLKMQNAPNLSKSSYYRTFIRLKDFGNFRPTSFTDMNGNELPEIDWISSEFKETSTRLEYSHLKVGDILVCQTDRFTKLTKDGRYKISELSEKKDIPKRLGVYHKLQYIKFEGYERKFQFNSWTFRKLSLSETRQVGLSSILENKTESFSVNTSSRKIDMLGDKNLKLIENIARSIVDYNRHGISVIDWACKMTGKNLGITPEDYNELIKMPFHEILKYIDSKEI